MASLPGSLRVRGALLVSLLSLMGCAPAVQPFAGGDPGTLTEDEGLLILHVDSDVPIKELLLDSGTVAHGIQRGEHVWVVRARRGAYRWSQVRLGPEAGTAQVITLDDEDEFRIEVEAGKLNYAGALILRSHHSSRSVGRIRVRHRNHAAMAIRRLRQRQAALVDRMPLHHGGHGGDRFFEYYERFRDREPGAERLR